ncbi:MAG: recombinase family protein, partial [bacterium]|nr:recombinase family protein [bacterium]
MAFQLPDAGAASQELAREVHEWWQEAAEKTDVDLSGFDPAAPLDERIAWALGQGLDIGTIYSRFSSKRQHSTSDQVRTSVQHAANKGIYCPPEFVCVDEAQRGYRARREGLDRMLLILKNRHATVLLVFKASRLYRQAFKGYQLIQQEVVEEGLRAISVTQGIDTADTKAWRMLFQVHGIVDDMVIEATADHVRAGLKGLFARGYTVGALPVGYRRKELPDAPVTNRGLTRTVPEVDRKSPEESNESNSEDSDDAPDVAEMIVEHYELIRDGMPIKQGWRKWVADGGPADPRSTKGYMTYNAYRRMLSRIAYTGRWEFGRKRNEFSTKRDYSRQIEQPDSEVEKFLCEELRIVDDELFFAVQRQLAKLKQGPRGPKKDKVPHLWDLVVKLFCCARCKERFHQTGAGNKGMHCKNGDLCPCNSAVRREEAVRAVCEKLCELIQQDAALIERTICRAQEIDTRGDDQLRDEISTLERKIAALSNKISDLYELAGQGNDDDRKEVMAKVRATQTERSTARHELSRLRQALANTTATVTPEIVRQTLAEFTTLLENAAAGKLGPEAVYKAVAVFRALVGGRVWVHVERRA